jgi:hypothetical protein|tara:strand:- start:3286 stop:4617 length:1332 start_codon:yes stop_codon:yes gene_type:complete
MKKILIIFLVLFLFPIISAVEIDMKDNFSQGETLIAIISGDFFEAISEENVIFYRGHVRTSIIPFVAKINNEFHVYANLFDKSPNDYSIVIENAKYFQGNQIIEEDITKNFTINENFANFSIDKSFVITGEDFFIEIKNLQDYEIKVDFKASNKSVSGGFFSSLFNDGVEDGDSIILNSRETKKINFNVEDFEGLSAIELSNENLKYEIMIYVFSKEENEKQEQKNFRFELSEINISMVTDSNTTKIIYLSNIGETEIENISLKISDSLLPYVSLSIDEIDELDYNSSKKIKLFILSSEEERSIEGQITAETSDNELHTHASVFLNFLEDYIPLENDIFLEDNILSEDGIPLEGEENFVSSQTCSELNGKICGENQKCGGNINYTADGVCCIGTCQEEKESSVGKIIGWSLLFGVIIFVIWFYLKKYKKVENVTRLMKILKRK